MANLIVITFKVDTSISQKVIVHIGHSINWEQLLFLLFQCYALKPAPAVAFHRLTFITMNGFVVFDEGIEILTGTAFSNFMDMLLGKRNTPATTEITTPRKIANRRYSIL